MTDDQKLPALRPLDVTPFRDDGALFFQLRDPLGIASSPLVISGAGYFVLANLDGQHEIADVQAAFREHTGQELPVAEIERVVEVLDHHAMLDTPRFAAAYAAAATAYREAPFRDSRPGLPTGEELRQEIEQILAAGSAEPIGRVRGLVAPHLDYPRGAPCYAAAYATLAQTPPADRYVILGTNHFGRSTSVVATTKDFRTPLGDVPTDRDFIALLEQRLGVELCEHELDHRMEHSIELQVNFLQVCQSDAPFEIVPILCPDICGVAETDEGQGREPDVAAFADALAAAIEDDGRSTILIAGADLSHVGQSFGDTDPANAEFLSEVERHDRALLSALENGEHAAAVANLRASQNPTRICSVSPLYALRSALPRQVWRTLHYHQATDSQTDTNVTCAAAVVY